MSEATVRLPIAQLCDACFHGRLDAAERILSSLPSKRINDKCKEGYSALYAAAREGHVEIVARLSAVSTLDLSSPQDSSGKTPCQVAAENGHLAVVALLVALGVNLSFLEMPPLISSNPISPQCIELFVKYFQYGNTCLRSLLEPFARKSKQIAEVLAYPWFGDHFDVSNCSTSQILDYIRKHSLGFIESLFIKQQIAIQSNTSIRDAADFVDAIQAVENKDTGSKLKFISMLKKSSTRGRSKSKSIVTPGSYGRGDHLFDCFDINPLKTNQVILKNATLEDIVDLLCLPSGDPLLVLWDQPQFIREFFLTYQAFATPSELFATIETTFRKFSRASSGDMELPPRQVAVCLSAVHLLCEWIRYDLLYYHGEVFEKNDQIKQYLSDFWNSYRQNEQVLSELSLTLFGNNHRENSQEDVLTIFMIGLSGVGRSSLLRAIVSNDSKTLVTSNSNQEEVSDPFTIIRKGIPVKVQLRSPAVTLETKLTALPSFNLCRGLICVIDITDRDSFRPFYQWYTASIKTDELPEVLVGTHSDCEDDRQLFASKVQDWTKMRGLKYEEISSTTFYNVKGFFERFVDVVLSKSSNTPGLNLRVSHGLSSALPRHGSNSSLTSFVSSEAGLSIQRVNRIGAVLNSQMFLSSTDKKNAFKKLDLEPVQKYLSERLIPLRSKSKEKLNAAPQSPYLHYSFSSLSLRELLRTSTRNLLLEDIDVVSLAKQIALVESSILQKLSPPEFLHRNWLTAESAKLSPAISELLSFTGKLRNFVLTEVLNKSSVKEALQRVSYFVVLSKELDNINCFNSLRSVVTALKSLVLIKKIWEDLPKSQLDAFQELSQMFIPGHNTYEKRVNSLFHSGALFTPQIGPVLADLKAIDGSTKDFAVGKLVNWKKMSCLATKIQTLLDPSSNLGFTEDTKIARFLSKIKPWEDQAALQSIIELRSNSPWYSSKGPDIFKASADELDVHLIRLLITGAPKIVVQSQEEMNLGIGGSIYFLHTGTVVRSNALDFIIQEYAGGGFIGLEACLGINNIKDTFVALTRAQYSQIDVQFVHRLCNVDEKISEALYRHICFVLNSLYNSDTELSPRTMSQKLMQPSSKVANVLGAESVTGDKELSSIFPDAAGAVVKVFKVQGGSTDTDTLAVGTLYLTQMCAAFDGIKIKLKGNQTTSKPVKLCLHYGDLVALSIREAADVVFKGKKEYRFRFNTQKEAQNALEICRLVAQKLSLLPKSLMTELSSDPMNLTISEWRHFVLRGAELRTLKSGTIILQEGSLGGALYLLNRGSVQVSSSLLKKPLYLNEAVDKFSLSLPTHNSLFGDEAFFNGGFSAQTVTVEEDDSAIYAIPLYYLNVLFECRPGFSGKFFRFLADTGARRLGMRFERRESPLEEEGSVSNRPLREVVSGADSWLTAILASAERAPIGLRASNAAAGKSSSFYGDAFFKPLFQSHPSDVAFFDRRVLYLVTSTASSDEKTKKFVRRLISSLSGYADDGEFVAGDSNKEHLTFLWQYAHVEVVLVEVQGEKYQDILQSSIPDSRLNAVVLIVPPTPSKTISNVQKWLSENRPRLFCLQVTPASSSKGADYNFKAVKGLKSTQLFQLANVEILRTWTEIEFYDKVAIPLHERSHLFDFANHLPKATDVFVHRNMIIAHGEGQVKLLDQISGRSSKAFSLWDIRSVLSSKDQAKLDEVVAVALNTASNQFVIMSRERGGAQVVFTLFDLLTTLPVAFIDPGVVPYAGSRMSLACVNDLLFITPERVLYLDSQFVYSAKPIFVISTKDGSLHPEFKVPQHRINMKQILIWDFYGKLKRCIGRDDSVDILRGNTQNLVVICTAPDPEDATSTVSVVEVISKSPTQLIGTYIDNTVLQYDDCVVDDKWILLESGNHQEIQVLSAKSRAEISRQRGTYLDSSFFPEHDLIAFISSEGHCLNIALSDPRREVIVLQIPLTVSAVRQSDFLEATSIEFTKWKRIKVYVLGEENVGKTHFIRTLVGEKYKVNMSTDGVNMMEDKSGEFTFRFMDFGGQEVFYPTHQFFLTGNSVYIIAFNMMDPHWSRVEYWLQTVHQLGQNSPVVIIGTHLDGFKGGRVDRAEFDKKVMGLRLAKRLVRKIFYVSNLKADSMKEIKPYLSELAYDLPSMKKPVPAEYAGLARLVERSKLPYAKWTQYAAMVGSDARSDNLKLMTQFFHDAGSLIWFKHTSLNDIVILDPLWLSELFSSIVSFKFKWRDGKLTVKDFDQIWKIYPKDLHGKLIELLERFDILFPITGNDITSVWLVPCMFATDPSEEFKAFAAKMDEVPSKALWRAERTYRFEFIPLGLFPRILMRFLQNVFHLNLKSHYWRNGIAFEGAQEEKALIVTAPDLSTIRVLFTSPRSSASSRNDSLFITLVHSIDAMLSSNQVKQQPIRSAICPDCYLAKGAIQSFTIDEISRAFQLGELVISGHNHSLPIAEVAPDVACCNVQLIAGDIADKIQLGSGAYGIVFRAKLKDQLVAVKELLHAEDSSFREFTHEVILMGNMNHDNIVRLLGITVNPLSMVMEFCPEGSLDQILYKRRDLILSDLYMFKVARDVASAMAYLHSLVPPLIHRDLRSPNVFIMTLDDAVETVAKVGDFGLAQHAAPHLTDFLGTWQWLSPEILNAVSPKYDHRSDIFAFAVVFSEILTRQLPYSNYEEFVLRQEHPLSADQVSDESLLDKLRNDGMIIDLKRNVVVSEVWQEQAIKSAIRDSNLRPQLPHNLEGKIKRIIELAWDPLPRERPAMKDISNFLSDHIKSWSPYSLANVSAGAVRPSLLTSTVLRRSVAHSELQKSVVADNSSSISGSKVEDLGAYLLRTTTRSFEKRTLQRKNHLRVLTSSDSTEEMTSVDLADLGSSSDEDRTSTSDEEDVKSSSTSASSSIVSSSPPPASPSPIENGATTSTASLFSQDVHKLKISQAKSNSLPALQPSEDQPRTVERRKKPKTSRSGARRDSSSERNEGIDLEASQGSTQGLGESPTIPAPSSARSEVTKTSSNSVVARLMQRKYGADS